MRVMWVMLAVGGSWLAQPAAVAGERGIDEVEAALVKAWAELAKGLPAGRKVNVAVPPFPDDLKGVTKLGVEAGDVISKKVVDDPRTWLASREILKAVIREQENWIVDLFEDRDPRKSARTRKLLKADYLVLGCLMATTDEVRFTIKLVESASGHVKAMSRFTVARGPLINDLLWYVQPPKGKPVRPWDVPPLELAYSVTAQRRRPDGGVEEVEVADGAVLRSGDQFQVHFRPVANCCVYILLLDSQGRASTLFPYKGVLLDNRRLGGFDYVVPDADADGKSRWFWLDEHPGLETLYIVASYRPMGDLAAVLRQMEKAAGTDRKALARRLREEIGKVGEQKAGSAPDGPRVKLGLGGLRGRRRFLVKLPDMRKVEKVGQVVRGAFGLVKEIRIRHR